MDKERIEKALNQCCSDDVWRPSLNAPFKQESFLIATDSHILIAIQVGDTSGYDYPDYADNKARLADGGYRVVDALSILKPYAPGKVFEPGDTFSISAIRLASEKFEYESIYDIEEVTCPECNGRGTVEYTYYASSTGKDYDVEFECPVCEGSGTVSGETDKVIGRMPKKKQSVRMFGELIRASVIKKLLTACEILNINGLQLVGRENYKLKFKSLDCDMPVYFLTIALYGPDEKEKIIESGL